MPSMFPGRKRRRIPTTWNAPRSTILGLMAQSVAARGPGARRLPRDEVHREPLDVVEAGARLRVLVEFVRGEAAPLPHDDEPRFRDDDEVLAHRAREADARHRSVDLGGDGGIRQELVDALRTRVAEHVE